MTVMPAANSLEALAEVRKAMDIGDDEAAPEFKWSTSEWKYEAWKAENFKSISAKLRSELKIPALKLLHNSCTRIWLQRFSCF
jgi:hypothetical protein